VAGGKAGGPVDVWAVAGIEEDELTTEGYGFGYFPARIPPSQVTLVNGPADELAPASLRGRHKKKQRKKKPRAGQ
jgi:hypothetical protein